MRPTAVQFALRSDSLKRASHNPIYRSPKLRVLGHWRSQTKSTSFMTKPKTKMISVRISEDDYLLLKDKHESQGIRSVSALARAALHNAIHHPNGKPVDLEAEVGILDHKLAALQREVSRLARVVAGLSPTKAAD